MNKFHSSTLFMLMLTGFIGGIVFASFYIISTDILLGILGIGVLVLSVFWIVAPSRVSGERLRMFIAVGVCIVAAFLLGSWKYASVAERSGNLPVLESRAVTIYGYVDGDFVRTKGGKGQFRFRTDKVDIDGTILEIHERTLVIAPILPTYAYGDTLVIKGTVRIPEPIEEFDYPAYLRRDGIFSLIVVKDIKLVDDPLELGLRNNISLRFWKTMFSVRDSFRLSVNRMLPEPIAAYINGILLGIRQDIPMKLQAAFNETSTSHILAISGYNVMIIASLVLGALVYFVKRRTAFWISALLIGVFTVVTGASSSVVRAAVMGLLVLFASGYGRLYDPKNGILLAGALMLWRNPFALRFDLGFQLSFVAVIGLLYLQPVFARWLKKVPAPKLILETLSATFAAQVAVYPLLAGYFGTASIISPVANVLILPFIPLAMTFGFLTGIGGMIFPILGFIFAVPAWAVATYQILVVRFLAAVPFASVNIPIHWISVVILYIFLVAGTIILRKKYKIDS